MRFRTEISIPDAPKILDPERHVVLVGSCFSDSIGARLAACGWPVTANPCGVVYNPASIAVLIQLAMANPAMRRRIAETSITEREGRYATWFMGSKALSASPAECVDKTCEVLMELEKGLEKASTLIVTFGTSDVWLLRGTDRAVGNCHKHPAAEFEKKRLSVADIAETWKGTIELLRLRNPELKVIFTVSPRRYLENGAADNSRLKAILLLACETLTRQTKNTYYFPAYEIMNDDLRDYRFYAKDLLHPSETAIDYIWEKLTVTYLDASAKERLSRLEKEARSSRHIQKS